VVLSCMGELKRACSVFVRKTEWQERFGLHKHRWDNNIKMGRKAGLGSVDGIRVAYGKIQWQSLVNTVVYLDFHKICELSRPSEHLLACQ